MNKILATLAMAVSMTGMTAPALSVAEPVRYELEPTHSFVNFEVKHFGTSTLRARFDAVEGYVVLDRQAGSGEAKITIDSNSISSGTPDFDKHLKSADFLDVAQTPKATFVGDKFHFDSDKLRSVDGALTLLGKTKPVTLTATNFNCYDQPVLKVHVCGGDFETTIKRSQWGMNWGLDMGIPDDVRLLVQVEAIQQ
jgi:polyisoprenoid-binding protein YceI